MTIQWFVGLEQGVESDMSIWSNHGRHEQARVVFEDGHRMFFYHVKPDCLAQKVLQDRIEAMHKQDEWRDA